MDRHKVTHVPVGARLPVSIREMWRRQTVHREWTYDGRLGEWDYWTHPMGWRAERADCELETRMGRLWGG